MVVQDASNRIEVTVRAEIRRADRCPPLIALRRCCRLAKSRSKQISFKGKSPESPLALEMVIPSRLEQRNSRFKQTQCVAVISVGHQQSWDSLQQKCPAVFRRVIPDP